MAESRDPVAPESPVSPPGIVVDTDITALRERGKRQRTPVLGEHLCTAALARELRGFCRRLLGSSGARTGLIDEAVDGLLAAFARGLPIPLRGTSDLVPVAHALHDRLVGEDRPFVVCDPRRRESEGTVRVPANRRTAMLALEAATGGSICLRARRLPRDFDRLCRSLRESPRAAIVFVCLQGDDRVRDLLCRPLEIPPLAERTAEPEILFQESLDEAAATLGTPRLRISPAARQGILERVTSFAELEKAALRIVALATAKNLSQAAEWLRMAPVSLSRWRTRRPWLTAILLELEMTSGRADN